MIESWPKLLFLSCLKAFSMVSAAIPLVLFEGSGNQFCALSCAFVRSIFCAHSGQV